MSNFESDSLKIAIKEELDSVNPTGGKVANHMVIMQQLVVVKKTTTLSDINPRRTTQSMKKWGEESLLNYQKNYFASVVEGKFKNEKKMLTTYG